MIINTFIDRMEECYSVRIYIIGFSYYDSTNLFNIIAFAVVGGADMDEIFQNAVDGEE